MKKKILKVKTAFPFKAQPLFRPYRYKVLRGGRGSGKSWSVARALLEQGMRNTLRVLCTREVQNSIKQSVHQLLKDQVKLMGIELFYDVTETEIRGKNGTLFSFSGLSQLTVDTIKSFEGYDIAWVEEGQAISDRSWKILLPTIRKDGSEVWITYNPDLETDPTHQRFTINPPPNTINIEMNWRDNPWWNKILEDERQHCKKQYPDDYDNIWEGKCRPAVEGAIYYKQIQQSADQNRICDVPYDPQLKVHVVIDLGWEDSMAIGMIQRSLSEIRIIDYIEDSHKTLNDYNTMLRERSYNWGRVYLPHDGFHKRVETGRSSYGILSSLGWDVVEKMETVAMSVEEGIRATRLKFHQLYIDRTKCERLIECLKRYRRRINRETNSPGNPLHDEFSHGADMIRYLCINADNMTNEGTPKIEPVRPQNRSFGRVFNTVSGWMSA